MHKPQMIGCHQTGKGRKILTMIVAKVMTTRMDKIGPHIVVKSLFVVCAYVPRVAVSKPVKPIATITRSVLYCAENQQQMTVSAMVNRMRRQ